MSLMWLEMNGNERWLGYARKQLFKVLVERRHSYSLIIIIKSFGNQ